MSLEKKTFETCYVNFCKNIWTKNKNESFRRTKIWKKKKITKTENKNWYILKNLKNIIRPMSNHKDNFTLEKNFKTYFSKKKLRARGVKKKH
jgi:hypothetical protein